MEEWRASRVQGLRRPLSRRAFVRGVALAPIALMVACQAQAPAPAAKQESATKPAAEAPAKTTAPGQQSAAQQAPAAAQSSGGTPRAGGTLTIAQAGEPRV